MTMFLFIIAVTLVVTGLLFVLVGAIRIRILAFKESLAWGLTCLFLPFGDLLFVVRFWDESKRLILTQIVGALLMFAGGGFILGSDGPKLISDMVGEDYDRRDALRKKHETLKKRDLERTMTLKAEAQERTRTLYGYVQNWHAELQAKRPGPNASAAEVEAFNREYTNYNGLLAEYKEAVKALSEETPAP